MEERYSRQVLFSPIGESGQEKLQHAHAFVLGCGALGSAIAETLVRAGIGRLTIADRDYVEPSNLQRQQLFTEEDAVRGVPKVVAAKARLLAIRSDASIETILDHVDGDVLERAARDADILLDATDNFEARLLLNDFAWKHGIPWVYGACVGSTSTVFPFIPGRTPCFRCLLPALPSVNETCDTAGVIAPAVQITAANQSAEALKWLTGNEQAMRTKLLHADIWYNTQVEAGISRLKKETCATCGGEPSYPSLHAETGTQYAVLCGRDTVQIIPDAERRLTGEDVRRVAERLGTMGKHNAYFTEFTADGYRCVGFSNGRLLVHGLKDMQKGRKIYHQLFG
ncbi:thiamine/molybdopterin biosynthesis protein MoeB [Sporosarcina sp. NCCP-2716]|uniref:ThiF family adenylyltransferase n=1 Tax=Sporosarcina sp. NCCP-2716 TaxID=2943679 RepID=UPI00203DC978|nr:ThiF family adenylyltransferase [Sporosarcina sp. NCCP-2716]GKV69040.1 thiamine/molybdopterin biosynthesis protein MoeB [Sporosarcina sp. NCCP-2716]